MQLRFCLARHASIYSNQKVSKLTDEGHKLFVLSNMAHLHYSKNFNYPNINGVGILLLPKLTKNDIATRRRGLLFKDYLGWA